MTRISCPDLTAKITSAEVAASFIRPGDHVGFSGFTGAGYPKALPGALAVRMAHEHDRGEVFRIGLWTGALTAPDADGALAEVDGISTRLPYNSDPTLRRLINSGEVEYVDEHLSHSAQHMRFGFYGNLDVAVVEVTAILPGGVLVPSTSVGNNKTWLDRADRVILEVNHWQPRELEGFHDIYEGTALPPDRNPIQLTEPMQRIGEPYLHVDTHKVVAVVETNQPDRNEPFTLPDETSEAIAGHALDFLRHIKGCEGCVEDRRLRRVHRKVKRPEGKGISTLATSVLWRDAGGSGRRPSGENHACTADCGRNRRRTSLDRRPAGRPEGG